MQALGQTTVPFPSVTGTRDTSPLDPTLAAASQQLQFAGLPRGNAYLLVMNGVYHIVLCGGTAMERGCATQPNQRR